MKALSPEMDDRHASALEFQQDLQAFIEGTRDRERRRSESLAMVAEGKKHMSAHRDLERRRDLLNEEARKVAKSVLPYEPVERKAELWNIEDAVANLERDASQEFSEARRLLDAAIQTDPDCHEARALLADLYWLKFQEAEAERNEQNTTFYRSLVEANDRGRYAVLLKGDGGLEVASEPPGAEAVLYRYREEGRILLPCDPQILGRTPLGPVSVPMGSYLLVLQHEGFRDTRYPLAIGRCERHSARVRLARDEEIGADFLHIPGGELIRGGDPESYGGHDRSKVHVDDFFIGRFPVTLGEYCEFLDALAAAGGDVSIHVPQQGEEKFAAPGPGGKYAPSATVIEEDPAAGGGPGREYYLKLPVFSVSWHSAMAFARWRSERDGREYTLPPEDAWEKAARGTDGRFYPWGDSFDWTFARGGLSRAGRNEPEPVGSFPADESPYGVRDLAGTIREWCADWFDEGAGTRVLRGGSWNLVVPHHFRAATRFGYRPAARTSTFGFRLYTREPLRGAAASAVTRKVSGTR
jgi:serine/threonine-protein kinase